MHCRILSTIPVLYPLDASSHKCWQMDWELEGERLIRQENRVAALIQINSYTKKFMLKLERIVT